jgi:hypothetical protein
MSGWWVSLQCHLHMNSWLLNTIDEIIFNFYIYRLAPGFSIQQTQPVVLIGRMSNIGVMLRSHTMKLHQVIGPGMPSKSRTVFIR